MNWLEFLANAAMTVSIVLAGRNSVHTWWTGIVGCLFFAALFVQAKLYADVTLQAFFVVTSAMGWWQWRATRRGAERPISHTDRSTLVWFAACGAAGAVAYGWLLYRWTDAYAPFLDSLVLSFSIVAQLLLMRRQIQTWWFWLLVNLLAVPLFFSRGLYITSALYAAYLANAVVAMVHWRTMWRQQSILERPA